MKTLLVFCDFLVAAGLAWALNSLSLRPFRRVKEAHWTERARVLWPARAGAATAVWILPVDVVLGQRLLWPEEAPPWLLAALVAWLGTLAATYPLDREIFPQLTPKTWLPQLIAALTIRFTAWLAFLVIAVSMPRQLDWRAWALCGVFFGILALWMRGGLIWLCRKLHLFEAAPANLVSLVQKVSSRLNVPFRDVWVLRSCASNAMAFPYTGDLLFTDRLLQTQGEEEVAAICAHELGHLGESRMMKITRITGLLFFVPLLLVKPLAQTWGPPGVYFALFVSWMIIWGNRRWSRKLEHRADSIAHSTETNPGLYARALEQLHKDNLIPAVMPRKGTHPDLYDRLLAADVEPNYPRPSKPSAITPSAIVLSAILGLLIAITFGQHYERQFNHIEPNSTSRRKIPAEISTDFRVRNYRTRESS